MGGADYHYSFTLFLETRKDNETFKKYNDGGGWFVTMTMPLITCTYV